MPLKAQLHAYFRDLSASGMFTESHAWRINVMKRYRASTPDSNSTWSTYVNWDGNMRYSCGIARYVCLPAS
jgi:hypothetical protein